MDGSDYSEQETFSDEVEIIVYSKNFALLSSSNKTFIFCEVRTKECLDAKLVSLAEDEGEKVAIVEFDTGEKRIR